ncbi:hypothetical protein AMTR_s00012p00050830 [Amborella trichopoda]|uniref:Uncharacterized protein n=1 Tax=Amborella trichopoda TaxID=13333 RepID=W1PJ30_AMBTC|nr:hypothetical protein AMTR_s00012p00050830 [Amborella trichopoda]
MVDHYIVEWWTIISSSCFVEVINKRLPEASGLIMSHLDFQKFRFDTPPWDPDYFLRKKSFEPKFISADATRDWAGLQRPPPETCSRQTMRAAFAVDPSDSCHYMAIRFFVSLTNEFGDMFEVFNSRLGSWGKPQEILSKKKHSRDDVVLLSSKLLDKNGEFQMNGKYHWYHISSKRLTPAAEEFKFDRKELWPFRVTLNPCPKIP